MAKAICAVSVGVRVAVVLLVLLDVGDGEVLLAEAEAKDDRVGERLVGVLPVRVLLRVALVPVRSLVVDGDGLPVAANLEHRVLGELALVDPVGRVEQHHARADGARDEVARLEGARRVLDDLVELLALGRLVRAERRGAVLLPEVEVRLAALLEELERVVAALVGLLDDPLRAEALDVALHLREQGAGVLVLLHLVAGAEHVEELGHVRDHVVEARRAVRRPWNVRTLMLSR